MVTNREPTTAAGTARLRQKHEALRLGSQPLAWNTHTSPLPRSARVVTLLANSRGPEKDSSFVVRALPSPAGDLPESLVLWRPGRTIRLNVRCWRSQQVRWYPAATEVDVHVRSGPACTDSLQKVRQA